jgi:SAM-dependent methyltransferase
MTEEHACGPIDETRARLWHWCKGPLGQLLYGEEKRQLDTLLSEWFGYHLIQVGWSGGNLTEASRIPHRVMLEVCPGSGDCQAYAQTDHLPLATDSVDVVLLPHTLEFAPNPHQTLREVDRILIPEGHLVILGFNPWGLWGLRRLWRSRQSHPPWCGRFFSLARIKDWLALLGLDSQLTRTFFFRPPLQHTRTMQRLQFMEKLGQQWWPMFGGVYLLMAKKRVTPLTPIKPRWQPRRSLIGAGLARPTGRIQTYD